MEAAFPFEGSMYHILFPFADGTAYHLMLGGKTLADAFDEYRRYHYNPCIPGSLAVYHHGALVGRIEHALCVDSGDTEPILQLWR